MPSVRKSPRKTSTQSCPKCPKRSPQQSYFIGVITANLCRKSFRGIYRLLQFTKQKHGIAPPTIMVKALGEGWHSHSISPRVSILNSTEQWQTAFGFIILGRELLTLQASLENLELLHRNPNYLTGSLYNSQKTTGASKLSTN